MPTYQYVCTNPDGKHDFEVVQSFTDAPVSACPECGCTVRKVYGSVGVVFKGSGFYRTDSRAGSSSGGGTKESSSGGGTKESSSGGGAKESSSAPAAASSGGSSSSGGTSSSGGGKSSGGSTAG